MLGSIIIMLEYVSIIMTFDNGMCLCMFIMIVIIIISSSIIIVIDLLLLLLLLLLST